MKRTLPLALCALMTAAGCGYGEMCFRDRCDPYEDYGSCGPWGCEVCPEGGVNDNGRCVPRECWCEEFGENTNCTCTTTEYPFCSSDFDCFPDETCENGECQWDEPAWCESTADCGEGEVCSAWNECRDRVVDCPLTETCLGDPEGYVPEWMGIDPLYMGEASGPGFTARVELLVDFYADHFYGDAVAVVQTGGYGDEIVDLIVTGDRAGADLDGQVVERNVQPRRFDATFTAQLITASEIQGEVTVWNDQGTITVPFHLYRVSPCGCDPETPECTQASDCPEHHTCDAGSCEPTCGPSVGTECCENADCPADHECVDQTCVAGCPEECCENADCLSGDECVNGACLTPCVSNCDCAAGEVCDGGYCQLAVTP